jgi:hypothetical protein
MPKRTKSQQERSKELKSKQAVPAQSETVNDQQLYAAAKALDNAWRRLQWSRFFEARAKLFILLRKRGYNVTAKVHKWAKAKSWEEVIEHFRVRYNLSTHVVKSKPVCTYAIGSIISGEPKMQREAACILQYLISDMERSLAAFFVQELEEWREYGSSGGSIFYHEKSVIEECRYWRVEVCETCVTDEYGEMNFVRTQIDDQYLIQLLSNGFKLCLNDTEQG